MDDTLELPPGLRAPPGWNEAHWVRLHLPPSSRPMSDEQWRKYVSIVSGCESGEMDMPTYGYSSRVFVFFSDPYYAEKILVTAAGLRAGPPLEHAGFPAIGYDVRARANGFDMDEDKSPELIISGIKPGYTLGDLFAIFRRHGFIFSITFRGRNKSDGTQTIAVRFFDIGLYNQFLHRPASQVATELVDTAGVQIRGLPSKDDFYLVANFLEQEYGRVTAKRYQGADRRSHGTADTVGGYVRFAHPDKAKLAIAHKFPYGKYPRLYIGTLAPLWPSGIPPPGAFTAGSEESWRGFQQEGALPQMGLPHLSDQPSPYGPSLDPSLSGAMATSVPLSASHNPSQTEHPVAAMPVRPPQPPPAVHQVSVHTPTATYVEGTERPPAILAVTSSSSSSIKALSTKPKKKKKKYIGESFPERLPVEDLPVTISSVGNGTATHRRWGRDPPQEPAIRSVDQSSSTTRPIKPARARSKERQLETHGDDFRPTHEVTSLTAAKLSGGETSQKSKFRDDSRIQNGALDDRDRFIIKWFRNEYPVDYSKIKDDLSGCLIRDQMQRFNTTLTDVTSKSTSSKRKYTERSDEPQFWMFEGNDSRGTLQELGLRMEEKTANRDLLRLDRVFEVEQRWMRELSRRSSQAPARQ